MTQKQIFHLLFKELVIHFIFEINEFKFLVIDYWKFFHKSLFIVGEFSINDYSIAILAGKSLAEVRSYVPSLVKVISKAIEVII